MNILIDMNLSPDWCAVLANSGFLAVHWRTIGASNAPDSEIMQWARKHNYVIFTHDLDFGTLLALTQATSPSVLQVRTQNVTPAHLQPLVVDALKQFENLLEQGAIVIIDEKKVRARILPLLH